MNAIRLVAVLILVGSLGLPGCGQIEQQGNCGGGYLLCDYSCVDPLTDPLNCGACGLVCSPDEVCSLGNCEPAGNAQLLLQGALPGASGREYVEVKGTTIVLLTDEQPGCEGSDRDGLTLCGGVCINTWTDRSHCGWCFNACPAGMSCRLGACTSECPSGLTNCGGRCVNVRVVREHCGACNRACASGEVCDGGECVLSCALGLTDCDGACVNVRFDPDNCGECGESCSGSEVCVNSVCTFSCGGDLTNCGGVCADLMTDPKHCGHCGYACEAYEICVHGTCALP